MEGRQATGANEGPAIRRNLGCSAWEVDAELSNQLKQLGYAVTQKQDQ